MILFDLFVKLLAITASKKVIRSAGDNSMHKEFKEKYYTYDTLAPTI